MKKIKLLLCLGVTLFLVGCSGTKQLDLSQYIDLVYMGYNESGIASPQIDEAGILEFQNENWNVPDSGSPLLNLYQSDAYTLEIEPNGNLANGDNVNVKVTINDENAQEYFTGGEFQTTVANLTEATLITDEDVWGALEFKLEGFNGTGVLNVSSEKYGVLSDNRDLYDNLSNGDKITFEISPEKLNDLIGFVYEGDVTYEYEVDGLPEPIDLSEEEILELTNASELFNGNGANGKGQLEGPSSITFEYNDIKSYLKYEILDNSDFKNGDLATIAITQEHYDYIKSLGVVLPNNGQFSVEVQGLIAYPTDITSISNFEELNSTLLAELNKRKDREERKLMATLYQHAPTDFDLRTIGLRDAKIEQPGTFMIVAEVTKKDETQPAYYMIYSLSQLELRENNTVNVLSEAINTQRIEIDEPLNDIIETLLSEGFVEI